MVDDCERQFKKLCNFSGQSSVLCLYDGRSNGLCILKDLVRNAGSSSRGCCASQSVKPLGWRASLALQGGQVWTVPSGKCSPKARRAVLGGSTDCKLGNSTSAVIFPQKYVSDLKHIWTS